MAALTADGFYDEVFAPDGSPRRHAAALARALDELVPDALAAAGRRRDAIFMQQGITFEVAGAERDLARDRPFPLDLVPRILPAAEWRTIKRGLAQRIRALTAHPRAQPLRRRRLPRARDRPRRDRPLDADRVAARVRAFRT